jgi:hypothetical protein
MEQQIIDKYVYYYADTLPNNSCVLFHGDNLFMVDIKSAFPTICKFLYGKDHWFVKEFESKESKLEKNKYICVTLANNKDDKSLKYKISDLNEWCKKLIFGYVNAMFENVFILEYKKDGILFISDEYKQYISDMDKRILDFIEKNNVEFHVEKYKLYLRYNKTSIYVGQNDELIIKGMYHDFPPHILNIIKTLLIQYDYTKLNNLLSEIDLKYGYKYYNVLLHSGLFDYINNLYKFGNNCYLDSKGNFTKSISEINPKIYKYKILYPIINVIMNR